MPKKNILLTASSFPLDAKSTKGNFIKEFAAELSKYHHITVLTHTINDAPKEEYFDTVKIIRYSFLPFAFLHRYFTHGVLHAFSNYKWLFVFIAPLYFLCQLFAIRKAVKREKIDIIHAHWIIPQGLAAVLYKKWFNRNIKIISTIHGGDIFAFKGRMGTFLKKYVIKNIDTLTVVSTHIKNEVLRLNKHKEIHVLPMGVYTTTFSPDAYDKCIKEKHQIAGPFLLFVGRLAEKKGVRYLIEAMPEILELYPDTKLLIAGNGSLLDKLQHQVSSLGLDENVLFLGNIEHTQLPAFYATADIFIGPSIVASSGDSEGFGLVFAEAAACKTLVITTDFPAMRDIIIDGKTGYTVAQKSSEAIANKVIDILKHLSSSLNIKNQARQHIVEHFDWGVIGRGYATLYKTLST